MDHRVKPDSKKNIIRCATRVLERDGIDHFSVRQVAKECGCAVSSLYRHFSGKDELLIYAGLWYIKDYFQELTNYWDEPDSIRRYFIVEQSFAKHTFAHPILFYHIYFGSASSQLNEILQDNLNLFRESEEALPEELYRIISAPGGLAARNLAMLKQCRIEGTICGSDQELSALNDGVIQLYRGYLDEAAEYYRKDQDTTDVRERYLQAHELLHWRFLQNRT